MNNQGQSYELRKESIIETVGHSYQEFLKTSSEVPSQALFKAYVMLTNEQKIAFILAGGIPSLSQWQWQHRQATWTRPDTETYHYPYLLRGVKQPLKPHQITRTQAFPPHFALPLHVWEAFVASFRP